MSIVKKPEDKSAQADTRANAMLDISERGLIGGNYLSGRAVSELLKYFSKIKPTERAATFNKYVMLMEEKGYSNV